MDSFDRLFLLFSVWLFGWSLSLLFLSFFFFGSLDLAVVVALLSIACFRLREKKIFSSFYDLLNRWLVRRIVDIVNTMWGLYSISFLLLYFISMHFLSKLYNAIIIFLFVECFTSNDYRYQYLILPLSFPTNNLYYREKNEGINKKKKNNTRTHVLQVLSFFFFTSVSPSLFTSSLSLSLSLSLSFQKHHDCLMMTSEFFIVLFKRIVYNGWFSSIDASSMLPGYAERK